MSSSPGDPAAAPAPQILDLRGEVCPFTFVRTRLRLEELPLGARLAVIVDHPPAVRNVPRSAREWGQEVTDPRDRGDGSYELVITRRR